MNEINETDAHELEQEMNLEPNDDYPGTFFRIPAPPNLQDTWSLN